MILNRIAGQIQDLEAASKERIEQRASTDDINTSVKSLDLTGGPADVTAFHDFKVLQMAFKDVWTELVDKNIQSLAAGLYIMATKHYEEMGGQAPNMAIEDIDQLNDILDTLQAENYGVASNGANSDLPDVVNMLFHDLFPDVAGDSLWKQLSDSQRMEVEHQAEIYSANISLEKNMEARNLVRYIASNPEGSSSRLAQLIYELGKALTEKYSFDIFAPDTCNYGIMLTYRQQWEPMAYQAGNLVSSIPLAPGEIRKYSKKCVRKLSRTEKQLDKTSSSNSTERSEQQRAEAEIMRKTAAATNFSMTTEGSFSMEMFKFGGSSSFGGNLSHDSTDTKKDFHEATLKAAEDYKKEHSLEVETSSAEETEETNSGEISNPNNEITVTYLFYELQRRYRISEQLHRAQAVVLVAQDVPAPHEIDEAWLVENQWILARFLLDESLRPALQYLTSGFAGDEVAIEVLRAQWLAQKDVLHKLENAASDELAMRDKLRGVITDSQSSEDMANATDPLKQGGLLGRATGFLFGDPENTAVDTLEAARRAAQTGLDYVESALADTQRKLLNASDAFQKATQEYASASQMIYTRRVAIDQLRVHVKQNILYYMQGIWDCEPPDQRYFRLFNKKVLFPEADPKAQVKVEPSGRISTPSDEISGQYLSHCGEKDLVEIADLDRPLGYKGNYMIFPLKVPCYLTTVLLQEFMDDYFGIKDPDALGNWPTHEVAQCLAQVMQSTKPAIKESSTASRPAPAASGIDKNKLANVLKLYKDLLSAPRVSTDEIVVPTGQLFIEALPGRHPLLEDFKLRHRMEDVRKAQAENRHAEMENLRLASRLVAGEREDPEIEKRILVDKGLGVSVGSPD